LHKGNGDLRDSAGFRDESLKMTVKIVKAKFTGDEIES